MKFDTTTNQIGLFDETEEYNEFVDKFKPKKTTDDCYTPGNVYDAVADWVVEEYGVDRDLFIRPFWPGADYEATEYPVGCIVVDNPPFSILSKVIDFYIENEIWFFIFAPTLTLFSSARSCCYIPCGCAITYENGAKVNTSFVTNLERCQVRSAPSLYQMVKEQNDINEKAKTKELPKYKYPDHVLTAAAAYQFSRYGVEFWLEKEDCFFTRALDAQASVGKTIFGGGFLLSEKAAAEKAAAEKAAAEKAAAEKAAATVWELSKREKDIVRNLGRK